MRIRDGCTYVFSGVGGDAGEGPVPAADLKILVKVLICFLWFLFIIGSPLLGPSLHFSFSIRTSISSIKEAFESFSARTERYMDFALFSFPPPFSVAMAQESLSILSFSTSSSAFSLFCSSVESDTRPRGSTLNLLEPLSPSLIKR